MDYVNAVLDKYAHLRDWYLAGGEGPHNLWLFGFCVFVVFGLMVSYYVYRKAAGYRKFRGTWYDEQQWQQLLKITYDDQQRGHRVMRHDEIKLLRKWELGRTKGFGSDTGSRF